MPRFAQVMMERLQATRLRLLDVYGDGAALSARARRGPMTPRAVPGRAAASETGDTWTLELEPVDGEPLESRPGQFTMLYAFGVGEVPISICGAERRPARAHGSRRRRGDARRSALRARATCSACAGRSGTRWPLAEAAGRRRRRSSPAASGSRRSGRSSTTLLAHRADYGEVALLYGSRTPGRPALSARARALARARRLEVDVTVDAAGPDWRGKVGVVAEARRDARASIRTDDRAASCGPEVMMRFTAVALARARRAGRPRSTSRWSATCSAASAMRPLPARPDADLPRRPGLPLRRARAAGWRCGSCERAGAQPKLAVWKFASCDGCQLSLLDCEDELLALAGEVEIAYFLEASQREVEGPYDLSLVEGSITTAARRRADPARSAAPRGAWSRSAPARPPAGSRRCATSPTSTDFIAAVYATPEYVSTLATSTPISAHVAGRLRAARLPDRQAPAARGGHRLPRTAAGRTSPSTSVCIECKRRGNVCVMVAHGTPCLGPVTHAGCGALCPAYNRGCYGCFGPKETPNTASLTARLRRARA